MQEFICERLMDPEMSLLVVSPLQRLDSVLEGSFLFYNFPRPRQAKDFDGELSYEIAFAPDWRGTGLQLVRQSARAQAWWKQSATWNAALRH
jgi:hypothetical protein